MFRQKMTHVVDTEDENIIDTGRTYELFTCLFMFIVLLKHTNTETASWGQGGQGDGGGAVCIPGVPRTGKNRTYLPCSEHACR